MSAFVISRVSEFISPNLFSTAIYHINLVKNLTSVHMQNLSYVLRYTLRKDLRFEIRLIQLLLTVALQSC